MSIFRTLVELDRASSLDERSRLVERLGARRRFQGARRLEDEGFRYLSHWYFPAIRELAARPDFRLDSKWSVKNPSISHAKAAEALEALVEIGMLLPTEDGGLSRPRKISSPTTRWHPWRFGTTIEVWRISPCRPLKKGEQ